MRCVPNVGFLMLLFLLASPLVTGSLLACVVCIASSHVSSAAFSSFLVFPELIIKRSTLHKVHSYLRSAIPLLFCVCMWLWKEFFLSADLPFLLDLR
jgi:hypothetical protein